jgi:hypothetical protein
MRQWNSSYASFAYSEDEMGGTPFACSVSELLNGFAEVFILTSEFNFGYQ